MGNQKRKRNQGARVDKRCRKCPDNWVITVESRRERHQEIIQSSVSRRAYEIFEQRGRLHGSDLDDWVAAEKELLHDDFDGDTTNFRFLIECSRDPEVTTILSMTTHSVIVFRSHARHIGKGNSGPDILSVHILPQEIDPALADVKAVEGLLHVCIPKKSKQTRPS